MHHTTRYLLIAACFVVFFVLAPLTLLYVTGYRFDQQGNKYVKTGILLAEVDPRGADIKLNAEKKGDTPTTIRFLVPGEYEVTISKEGYFTWSKRLQIEPSKVTSVAEDDKLYLLRNDQQPQSGNNGAIDFVLTADSIIYLTESYVVIADSGSLQARTAWELPFPARDMLLSPDEKYLLLRQGDKAAVFDINGRAFRDVSTVVPNGAQAQFSANGQLLVHDKGTLNFVAGEQQTKTALLQNIRAFKIQNNTLYYLRQNPDGTLALASASTNNLPAIQEQIIVSSLPNFQTANLITTPQKELFIAADNRFYSVGNELNKLADNVLNAAFNPFTNSLTVASSGELYYYNFDKHYLELVTRSTAILQNPLVDTEIGYAFFVSGDQLTALELDMRDKQNNYALLKSGAVKKFVIDKDSRTLYLLQGDQLKALTIR